MLNIGDAINILIPVNGEQIAIPGIAVGQAYFADRINRATGSKVPTQMVDVVSWHNVPADRARAGQAFSYYQLRPQSTYFMEYRTEACPELDELTADELKAKVDESRASLPARAVQQNPSTGQAIKTKISTPIVFDETRAPAKEKVAASA